MNRPEPQLSEAAKTLPRGIYEHFRGNRYRLLEIAFNSETLEELVIYEAQYGDHPIFARPLGSFLETVELEEKIIPRFRFLGNSIDQVQ